MKITIGANIKSLRQKKGITQDELSAAMNVSSPAVSKWERDETYPDITLLQPLAYYFGVSLDELMGYNKEKIQADIDNTVELYLKSYRKYGAEKTREFITKAYSDYPNDYRIMNYYMWNIAGDAADNDPAVLIAHKDEFLGICDKIIEGCTDENIRLGTWNMRAKILHAEGRTDEALNIYNAKFTNWYGTCGQKSEQLFAKDTSEYYFHVRKNMYELAEFAADKFGRKVFFDTSLSMEEKVEHAIHCGNLLLSAFEETDEAFFLMIAESFLGRMENDLCYRGGTDEQVAEIQEKYLFAASLLTECMKKEDTLYRAFYDCRPEGQREKPLIDWITDLRMNAKNGRRAELLKNPKYASELKKYSKNQ